MAISGHSDYIAELVGLAPDLIVANSTPALAAMHAGNHRHPGRVCVVVDPVGLGFKRASPCPGREYHRLYLHGAVSDRQMARIAQAIATSVSRAALLFNPDTAPYYLAFLDALQFLPHPATMELAGAPVHTIGELEATVTALARAPGSSLLVTADPFNLVHREAILRLITQHRLPTLSVYRQFAEEGALMSYGPTRRKFFGSPLPI